MVMESSLSVSPPPLPTDAVSFMSRRTSLTMSAVNTRAHKGTAQHVTHTVHPDTPSSAPELPWSPEAKVPARGMGIMRCMDGRTPATVAP